MQFTMEADRETFFEVIYDEIKKPIDPMELVYPREVPIFEKYDEYVPEELICKGFAYGVLDLEGLKKRILEWEAMEMELGKVSFRLDLREES